MHPTRLLHDESKLICIMNLGSMPCRFIAIPSHNFERQSEYTRLSRKDAEVVRKPGFLLLTFGSTILDMPVIVVRAANKAEKTA